ncbi:hypothetical protein DV738_g5412, partial [Chaetothyriales sp. CBS 135597]
MVHISLPHRLSRTRSKEPDLSTISSPSQNNVSTGTTAAAEKPLILKVNVIRGRNLAAKDRSGTSDPYLVVMLGRSKQSTPSISKTLNPEWNICLDLPLTDVPLLECVCWDKDRFKNDYMGEFDIAIEDIFSNGEISAQPRWFKLRSKRTQGKRKADVSGEIQMSFSLIDSANPNATTEEIVKKFLKIAEDDDDMVHGSTTQADASSKAGAISRKEKKKKLAMLRRKSIAVRAYEFVGSSIAGMIFMEIVRVTDLPPEKNMTRTSFDMDPFVVTALGRKVLRTKVIRHNLNPVYNEKMVFQVLHHETGYSLTFTVIDKDNLSGNDFVASAAFPISTLIATAPDFDPDTGLYNLPEPPDDLATAQKKEKSSRFKLPLSRTSSHQNIAKLGNKPGARRDDPSLLATQSGASDQNKLSTVSLLSSSSTQAAPASAPSENGSSGSKDETSIDDLSLETFDISLELKNKERWEAKHSPSLQIRGIYMPYRALRQQFWRAMLKQYDADESRRISRVELTTMLDTLGSTLRESTIDGFFERFSSENEDVGEADLTFDQAVICLEDQLEKTGQAKKSAADKAKTVSAHTTSSSETSSIHQSDTEGRGGNNSESAHETTGVDAPPNERGTSEGFGYDLSDGPTGEEHVIEIRECPICHQPKLNKRSDAEIVTHIATCASADWRQVNNLVMGGFVTQSQAQRKWYSKVITKISYGGYHLGANSANILVQDRITGQISEERMSVYVRLGIRLLYKAVGSREMEKKRIKKMLRSLSIKQGKKYDDPASASQIEGFIQFHQLDMSEVLLSTSEFRNFNEFFYRALKPNARPCSAPDRPEIIVSPADCRSVVFNTIEDATRIWVKGRDYSLERLFGDAYPLDAKRYKGGSMGIFRLAPQDYHRFHIPVDGVLGVPKLIEGEYYTVNPMAIRSALDVYGENVRVVTPIDSVAHGRVMYVCIGAMMVGSTVITRKPGEKVKRGEELGYFKFGGSTVLLFFEPGKMVYDSDLVENSKEALETLVRVGMSIGHSPDAAPYEPDMKKDASKVTEAEKQEALRRIQGSFSSLVPTGENNGDKRLPGNVYRAKTSVSAKYEIIGFISSGTYGRVYKAREKPGPNSDLKALYAIKRFKPEREGDAQLQWTGLSQSAIREMALCSELSHPNIVHLAEIILEDKSVFMVFEYCEHDLLHMIKSILFQLLNGLFYLHTQAWVLHRDLKPANIMVTSGGHVRIGDLGLARLFYKPLQSLWSGDKVVVTIWYRSPDLLLGAKHYTPAIDMWAVGCIFAELLSLRPIFKGEETKMDSKKTVPFQRNQMGKIVEILGMPRRENWKGLAANYPPDKSPGQKGYQLLSELFEYDPDKRLTAEQALHHEYFRNTSEGPNKGKIWVSNNCFEGLEEEYPARRVTPESTDTGSASLPGSKRAGGLVDDGVLPAAKRR